MRRLGILGGTFDPIHRGHIMLARVAKDRLALDEVLFVPAGQPWMKAGEEITPAAHRAEMVRLAIAGEPGFSMSDIELKRVGPTYTIDTVDALRGKFGPGTELFFIMGWDSFAQLPRWREASRLIQLCWLVAAPRPGYPRPDFNALERELPGISKRVSILDEPHVDISATEIRQRITHGEPIEDLVPEPVAEYIYRHSLYAEKAQKDASRAG